MYSCGSSVLASASEVVSICEKAKALLTEKRITRQKVIYEELVLEAMQRKWLPNRTRTQAEKIVNDSRGLMFNPELDYYMRKYVAASTLSTLCVASVDGKIKLSKEDAEFLNWMKGIV